MTTMTTPTPKTVSELLGLISSLVSRQAVYRMVIVHLRTCYRKTDTGPAEMRVTREDGGVVPQEHIEDTIIEIETQIDLARAELEELVARPVGGGPPPAAEVDVPQAQQPAPAQPAERKVPSGKTRPSSGSPS